MGWQLASLSLAALLASIVVCGCTRPHSDVDQSRLAVTRSNQEAERLYQIKPFKEEHGHWREEGQQRIWEALTSYRGHDVVAKVTFDERGGVVDVDVEMLADPTTVPTTNLHEFVAPERPREKELGIPEVIPK